LYNSLAQQTMSVEREPKLQAPAPAVQNYLGSGSTALLKTIRTIGRMGNEFSIDVVTHALERKFVHCSVDTWFAISSVASPKFGRVQKIWGAKMYDCRKITLFCLGYNLSQHNMTICSEIWGIGPLGPPWLSLCLQCSQCAWISETTQYIVRNLMKKCDQATYLGGQQHFHETAVTATQNHCTCFKCKHTGKTKNVDHVPSTGVLHFLYFERHTVPSAAHLILQSFATRSIGLYFNIFVPEFECAYGKANCRTIVATTLTVTVKLDWPSIKRLPRPSKQSCFRKKIK